MSNGHLSGFERIAGGLYLEGLAIDPSGAAWFSDVIAGGAWHVAADGQRQGVNPERQWTGGLLFDVSGRLLSTGQGGILLNDLESGASHWLANEIDGAPINGVNEMAPDGAGGLWFGTVDLDAIIKGEAPASAALYHLSAHGMLRLAYGPVGFANGMALSADRRTLFLNESFDGTYAFDVNPDLTLSNRRKLLGKKDCDGLAIDADGTLWITGFRSSHIVRLNPDGMEQPPFETPAEAITQIRFGGADMCDVWITCVPGDAGAGLAVGDLPTSEVSFLYRGRSDAPGLRLPDVMIVPAL